MAQTHVAHQRIVSHQARTSGSRLWAQLIYWVAGVIETILAFRFALLLFGANPSAGFVQFIYQISAPFMSPFAAVFGATKVDRAIFDWSILLAILVYATVAWGIGGLIERVAPTSGESVEEVEEIREREQTPPQA